MYNSAKYQSKVLKYLCLYDKNNFCDILLIIMYHYLNFIFINEDLICCTFGGYKAIR